MKTNNKPEVSFIVPCYNHGNYVEKCIESIMNQTYDNIRLVVMDDGSKDNSPEVITRLAEKHGFQYELQDNMGLPKTLNKAITKYAKGKYIIGLASDDYLPEDSVEKRVSFMEENPQYAVCYGRTKWFNDKYEIVKLNREPLFKSGWLFDDLFLGNFWIPAPTAIMRKSALDEVGLYDENIIFEDYYMWLKLSSKFEFGFLDDFLTFYRVHESNFHKRNETLLDQQKIILSAYSDHKLYKKAIQSWNYRCFIDLCTSNKKRAFKHMTGSLNKIHKRAFIKSCLKLIK